MPDHASVMVIIVTFNGWEDTRACLKSVYASEIASMQVVVVNNASTDEMPSALHAEFPEVRLIVNPRNVGYAASNNIGLRAALEAGVEFALVLNNDVVVASDCIRRLLAAARADLAAALLGPLVLHADEPNVIQSAGGILPADWHSYHRAANQTDTGQFANIEHVDWLSGCAVLARGAALREIGLLDPSFFMYGEDVDWCVRARRAGFRVLLIPHARVWHKGVQRAYAPAPYVTYYSARNELALMRKHRAGTGTLLSAEVRHLRTLFSWSVMPRWRGQRAHRDALALALRDFMRGKSGRAELVGP